MDSFTDMTKGAGHGSAVGLQGENAEYRLGAAHRHSDSSKAKALPGTDTDRPNLTQK